MHALRRMLIGRVATGIAAATSIVLAVVVAAATLPRLPQFSIWPALLGLLPFTIGKYLLCPMRWHGISQCRRGRSWHLAVFAEAEVFGLLTPGHVGADVWRTRRLVREGLTPASAAADVCLDRFVGAIGLLLFVGCAGATLPVRMAMITLAVGGVGLVAVLAVNRFRPHWMPRRALPPPRQLVFGLLLSVAYQATTIGLLISILLAIGYHVSLLGVLGAFGASQMAAAVPGPNGASPRDGALALALTVLGVPWVGALGAVTLKALLPWAPALLLGGGCFLVARRRRTAGTPPSGEPDPRQPGLVRAT